MFFSKLISFGKRDTFYQQKNVSTLNPFNPCKHRATIVAQAYLKSFKKGEKQDRTTIIVESFLSNTL